MRALWRIAPTTLVGIPCLVVLLANHRGLGSKRVSGYEDGCWFVASAVCRHTLAGVVRVNERGRELRLSACGDTSCRGPRKGGRELGVVTAPEGGTECPNNDTGPQCAWCVFENGKPPLPTIRAANRRMQRLQGVD